MSHDLPFLVNHCLGLLPLVIACVFLFNLTTKERIFLVSLAFLPALTNHIGLLDWVEDLFISLCTGITSAAEVKGNRQKKRLNKDHKTNSNEKQDDSDSDSSDNTVRPAHNSSICLPNYTECDVEQINADWKRRGRNFSGAVDKKEDAPKVVNNDVSPGDKSSSRHIHFNSAAFNDSGPAHYSGSRYNDNANANENDSGWGPFDNTEEGWYNPNLKGKAVATGKATPKTWSTDTTRHSMSSSNARKEALSKPPRNSLVDIWYGVGRDHKKQQDKNKSKGRQHYHNQRKETEAEALEKKLATDNDAYVRSHCEHQCRRCGSSYDEIGCQCHLW